MPDIDVGLLTPSTPNQNDFDLVRRGLASPFSIELVPSAAFEIEAAKRGKESLLHAMKDATMENFGFLIEEIGTYLDNTTNPGNLSTFSLVAANYYLTPFIPKHSITVDEIGVAVSTASASGFVRSGIYDSDPVTKMPKNVLFEGAGISASTVGFKGHLTSLNLIGGSLYWLCARSSSANVTVRGLNNAAGLKVRSPNFSTETVQVIGYQQSLPASSPLPNSPTSLTVLTSTAPIIRLKIAGFQ